MQQQEEREEMVKCQEEHQGWGKKEREKKEKGRKGEKKNTAWYAGTSEGKRLVPNQEGRSLVFTEMIVYCFTAMPNSPDTLKNSAFGIPSS